MTIIRHPKDWTPNGLLKELLREDGDIESLVVVAKYQDGSYGRVWSKQGMKELVFKKELLDQSVRQMMDNGQQE